MLAKRCLLVLAVWGLTLLFITTAYPASKYNIETLRGLTGVNVAVDELDNEIKKELPFVENQIKVDTELKLRMAGIKFFSEEQWLKTSIIPFLHVNLNIMQRKDNYMFYFCIKIALNQEVYLERNPNISLLCAT